MDRGVGAAARLLPGSDRKDLAIQALAGSETVCDLAARHGVSRKFVYRQTHKARAALDDAFSPAVRDDEVLFEPPCPLCQESCPAPRDDLSFSEGRDGGNELAYSTERRAA